MTRWWR